MSGLFYYCGGREGDTADDTVRNMPGAELRRSWELSTGEGHRLSATTTDAHFQKSQWRGGSGDEFGP
jgi:hypothetical protein